MKFEYVNIFNPPDNPYHQYFAERVKRDEFAYPVVLVNEEVVGEGNPRLKAIYQSLEENGIS